MSYLLERLKALKGPKKRKVVSPAVEFVYQKRKSSGLRPFFLFLLVLVLMSGVFLVFLLNNLYFNHTQREVKHSAQRHQTPVVSENKKPSNHISKAKAEPSFIKEERAGPVPEPSGKKNLPPSATEDQSKKKVRSKVAVKKEAPGPSARYRKRILRQNDQLVKEKLSRRNYFLYIGRSLQEEGKLEEALHYYKQALKLDPENPDILRIVGTAYLKLKNCEEAERYLMAEKKGKHREYSTLVNLGLCELERGNLSGAEHYLRRAKKVSNSVKVLYNLGYLMYRKKDFKEAERYLTRASNTEDQTLRVNALLLLAAVKEATGQYSQAIGLYSELQKTDGLSLEQKRYVQSRLRLLPKLLIDPGQMRQGMPQNKD